MKQRTAKIMIIASALTLGLATAAIAQLGIEGNNVGNTQQGQQQQRQNMMQPQPPMQQMPRPVMDSSTSGVYLLEGSRFTKYDSITLKQLGQLDLGITADAAAANGNNLMPTPPVPGDFRIYTGSTAEYLLAVAGDTFYKIDSTTFTIIVKTTLPALKQPQMQTQNTTTNQAGDRKQLIQQQMQGNNQQMQPGPGMGGPQGGQGMGGQQGGPGMGGQQGGPGMGGQQGGQGMQQPAPPVLDLNGDTLYVLRGKQLTAINAIDGSIKATIETANPAAQRVGRNNQQQRNGQ